MLKNEITSVEVKKIFQNKDNKVEYLNRFFDYIGKSEPIEKTNTKIEEQIISTWNYEASKTVIREMFRNTEKYHYISRCKEKIDVAINEWNLLRLGKIDWPFSAMNFDQHVHQINRDESMNERRKDFLIARQCVKFRRIKQINALRNDYIEYLIFKNENVIPTFGNNRGVDFYIDGEPYDQKVSKSVGKIFQDKYGDDYRNIAIKNPNLVAESMYENQDEERFGDEPRLLIIYLDSDVTSQQIEDQLCNIDFNDPMTIEFKYKHSNHNTLNHKTKCFVVLLHH